LKIKRQMKNSKVIEVLQSDQLLQPVTISGWVRSFRNDRFIAVNDGSTIKNIQCVLEDNTIDQKIVDRINVGAAVIISGTLEESSGKGQRVEIKVSSVIIEGEANPEELKLTILSPKRHSLEKLREQAHLRVRTNTFGAIMRLRSKLSFAVHEYFQKNDFYYVHTPIITGSDAEGAGEAFKVTNFDLNTVPKTEDGKINYSEDFFGREANLTVSGQLEGETYAMGLGQIYTFGPTFRDENSNTSRNLAEF